MELIVQKRTEVGKQLTRLRDQGLVPAELYGYGIENQHVAVPALDFKKVFREAGESTLIDVVLDGKKHPVMIHHVSRDPVSDEPMSVDFYTVRLDERISVRVPLHFTGEAPAVKEFGGLLVKAMHEIDVEAFPNKIPHAIEVSLNNLKNIGESLRVKDLVIPAEVEVDVDGETVVASVTEKAAEEEAIVPEVSIDSIKVETEERKAERDAKNDASASDENA